eukprot:1159491-Pelagomonas_calceolata.AAC.25
MVLCIPHSFSLEEQTARYRTRKLQPGTAQHDVQPCPVDKSMPEEAAAYLDGCTIPAVTLGGRLSQPNWMRSGVRAPGVTWRKWRLGASVLASAWAGLGGFRVVHLCEAVLRS